MTLERIVLLNCIILFFLFWLISLPLSPDEAHYYLWSQQLDWSYYSKGPMLGLVIKLSTLVFGKSEHSVRLPALIFSYGSIFLVYRYLANNHDFVNKTKIYLIIFSSVAMWYQALLMTTDAPAIFFWLLSCLSFKDYLDSEKCGHKLILGSVALGLGIWSKYTILIVFAIFSIFLLRRVFLKTKPFNHLLIFWGVILFFITPILSWNYSNDWVNFQHNAGHLGSGKTTVISLSYFFDFLGGQIGMYGLFVIPILYYGLSFIKQKTSDGNSFLFLNAAGLFLVCMLVSFLKRVYPNWTIPAFPLIVLALAGILSGKFIVNRKLFNLFLGLNGLVTITGVLLMFGFTFGLPGRILPTKKLVGWRAFSSHLLDNKLQHQDVELIISESYDFVSELRFYVPSLNVYNTTLGGRRMNQFDIWQQKSIKLKANLGKPVLLVLSSPHTVDLFRDYFSRIEELPPEANFSYLYSGELLRTAYLFKAYDYNGKPFSAAFKH